MAFAELVAATNFSFLHGASHASDMVARAMELGLDGLGIADRNTVAGVVRAWKALRKANAEAIEAGELPSDLKLVTGTRLIFADGTPDIVAYPQDRAGWGRLCRLLSAGNLRADKGDCVLGLGDLLEFHEGLLLIVLPKSTRREGEGVARDVATELPGDEDTSSPPTNLFVIRAKAGIQFTGRLNSCLRGNDGEEDGRGQNQEAAILAFPQRKQRNILASTLEVLQRVAPDRVWLGATAPLSGRDRRRLARLARIAETTGVPLLATNDVLHATREDRPLQDVLTCIRLGTTIVEAGKALEANGERHLKSAEEIADLFPSHVQAIEEAKGLLDRIHFDLKQLEYEYPHEPVPKGWTPIRWLGHLVGREAAWRWPNGVPAKVRKMLREEFTLIARQNIAYYFLTVHDVVRFARAQQPPILCQGRGSAANSMVCYLLGITSVDPAEHNLLFSRFLSEDRGEPPDIDVDFEHERREEVMQYIYRRYGRHRAGIVATVIHYRSRSAVREVGKVLGLTEDVTTRLVSTVWGSFSTKMDEARFRETGFSLDNPQIARLHHFVGKLLDSELGFPRHLSQHVGGFVLSEGRLDEIVPVHNAAMDGRTFIEWDKDDIDALCLMKVDVLSLGMLTCIRKAFDLIRASGGPSYELDTIPAHHKKTYKMLQRGDSLGVFQVESRAQMNMLPRLRPRKFYDLVVQVAIVRPGPIQGDMVHPYLRRRSGKETPEYPSPAPPHDRNELRGLLGKTYGVPLFQEQVMKLAIVAAEFSAADANRLRRAMATFRRAGGMDKLKAQMIDGMTARGYERDFAERCYRQIEGFGSYGFPESHALSFARLVYVSAYIKRRFPAAFCAALLNSQPMGFYAPAQIVGCAKAHGVEVRPVDVSHSGWDNSLEAGADDRPAVRLGFRQIDGFREEWVTRILPTRSVGRGTARAASGGGENPRTDWHFPSTTLRVVPLPICDGEDVKGRGKRGRYRPASAPSTIAPFAGHDLPALARILPARALRLLADADALRSLGMDRREGLWAVRRLAPGKALPLFAAMEADEHGAEADAHLPAMPQSEHVAADYQITRLSLKGHPMHFLRDVFRAEGIKSAAEIAATPDGRRAKAAGVVLVRQRPGEGKAIFVTLEDETGVVNVLLWARDFERCRMAVMSSRLMEVRGVVQKSDVDDGVIHLMTTEVIDRTAELARLSEDHQPKVQLSRADIFEHPIYTPQGSGGRAGGRRHPRDVRILPGSRDFH